LNPASDSSHEPILEARGLTKSYRRGGRLLSPGRRTPAFAGIDLSLRPGVTVGLVGASGAGKSSLARCLSLLEMPDGGALLHRGRDYRRLDRAGKLRFRSEVQLVFQQSSQSFNPRWRARQALEEPMRLLGGHSRGQLRERVDRLAESVGLDPAALSRRTPEFSGGQLRRLNLARALGVEPQLLILDEPFSGLDVSLQAQIANLLAEIQRRRRLACLYISHDLEMIARLADEVAVLDRGRIVERGPVERVLLDPREAPTRALVEAGTSLRLPGADGPAL